MWHNERDAQVYLRRFVPSQRSPSLNSSSWFNFYIPSQELRPVLSQLIFWPWLKGELLQLAGDCILYALHLLLLIYAKVLVLYLPVILLYSLLPSIQTESSLLNHQSPSWWELRTWCEYAHSHSFATDYLLYTSTNELAITRSSIAVEKVNWPPGCSFYAIAILTWPRRQ